MRLVIILFVIFAMFVVCETKQKPLKTAIWEFVDDNMPKEWRPQWRKINEEYQNIDQKNSRSSAKPK